MSDDLTITLRGQEAYDYLQWRAVQQRQNTPSDANGTEPTAKAEMKELQEGMAHLLYQKCNACKHQCFERACKKGHKPNAYVPCSDFTPF